MTMFKKYGLYINSREKPISLGIKNSKFILSQTLDTWQDPKDIKDDVLPEIDQVLSGEIEEGEIGSEVGVAFVDANQTFIGNSSVGYEQMLLPTEDFRQLWVEWMAILEKHKNKSYS